MIALSKALPESWTIICNKILFTDYGRSFELDMIIVGEHSVYVVDEKSWRGHIICGAEKWTTSSGIRVRSPLTNVDMACKILSGHLRREIAGMADLKWFAYGFVMLSDPEVEPDFAQCPASDRVLRLATAARTLRSLDAARGQRGVDLRLYHDAIVKYLLGSEELVDGSLEAEAVGSPGARNQEPSPARARSASALDLPAEPHRRARWFLVAGALLAAVVVFFVWHSLAGDSGSSGSPSPSPSQIVLWQDAHNHIDEFAAVQGPVRDVEISRSKSDGTVYRTYINIGKVFRAGQAPDPGRFYCLVPGEDDASFRAALAQLPGSPGTPSAAYANKIVRMSGTILESRGEPYMVIHSPDAITLVEP